MILIAEFYCIFHILIFDIQVTLSRFELHETAIKTLFKTVADSEKMKFEISRESSAISNKISSLIYPEKKGLIFHVNRLASAGVVNAVKR